VRTDFVTAVRTNWVVRMECAWNLSQPCAWNSAGTLRRPPLVPHSPVVHRENQPYR
jgi:hypothetical protein